MFENDNEQDRQLLISRLEKEGIEAGEFDFGGGIVQVIVPIIETYSDPPVINSQDPQLRKEVEVYISKSTALVELFIATNSLFSDCEIGLYGTDGLSGGQISSSNWKSVESVDEAVNLIISLWNQRDTYLDKFINANSLD